MQDNKSNNDIKAKNKKTRTIIDRDLMKWKIFVLF
jgi:hypothetical protein